MTDRNSWCTGADVRACLEGFAIATTGFPQVFIDPCSNPLSKVKAQAVWTEASAKAYWASIGVLPRRVWRKDQEVEIVPPAPLWGLCDGYTSFVNWPFSDPQPWADACVLHCAKRYSPDGCEARWIVGLGICDPTTQWWGTLEGGASLICFPRKRLHYEPPPGVKSSSNDRPSAIWLLQGTELDRRVKARDAQAFIAAFSALGRVRPARDWAMNPP